MFLSKVYGKVAEKTLFLKLKALHFTRSVIEKSAVWAFRIQEQVIFNRAVPLVFVCKFIAWK